MLLFFIACATEKSVDLAPTVPEWGSWQLSTSLISETLSCSGLGASGASMSVLFGEMDVFGDNDLEFRLGSLTLQGYRDGTGFFASSFQEIPITGNESDHVYGIIVEMDAEIEDTKNFKGTLNYILDFPNGYCSIALDVDAFWLYYEPPPTCES
ncbi:MAG: hypothetical protein CMK59_04345 [Proteobacteria bacterium]|nr:hypothetical protein [Pseudomonadota bacterium]